MSKHITRIILVVFLSTVILSAELFAQDNDWLQPCKSVKQEIEKATDTKWTICADMFNSTILDGKTSEGRNRTVFAYDIGLERKVWENGKVIMHVKGGRGRGVGEMVGSDFSLNWMANRPADMFIATLFLEQIFPDSGWTFWVGKMDSTDFFDTNKVLGWDFLSCDLAFNSTVHCGDYALGIIGEYKFSDSVYMRAGVIDAQGAGKETGFNTAFSDEDYLIGLAEIGINTNFIARPGTWRFGLWYDPQPADAINGHGQVRDDRGFYMNFEQDITDKLSIGFRYSYADPYVHAFKHCWSLGAAYTGLFESRPDDVLSCGVVQAVIGDQYKSENAGSSDQETLIETFYKIKVNENLSIKPDLQFVLNPGASNSGRSAVIGSVQVSVEF